MTCEEYLALIATAPTSEPVRMHLRAHAASCPHCGRIEQAVADREAALFGSFESAQSRMPVHSADHALRTTRRKRVDRIQSSMKWFIALAGIAWFVSTRLFPPTPVRGDVVEAAVVLRCLSPEEAGVLLQPVLGREGTIVFRGEPGHSAMTIRGTAEQVRQAKLIVERNEQQASCSVDVLPGPTR